MESDHPTEGLNDEVEEPLRRRLDREPDESSAEAVEDSFEYEQAVEEGTARPPSGQDDPGAGELAPEFREPDPRS